MGRLFGFLLLAGDVGDVDDAGANIFVIIFNSDCVGMFV